jgi:hypothetical protein
MSSSALYRNVYIFLAAICLIGTISGESEKTSIQGEQSIGKKSYIYVLCIPIDSDE